MRNIEGRRGGTREASGKIARAASAEAVESGDKDADTISIDSSESAVGALFGP